jgi:hypothetical protein
MFNPLEEPLPESPIQRVRAFARDLAYGVSAGLCSAEFGVTRFGGGEIGWWDTEGKGDLSFLETKWQVPFPFPSLMIAFGYFESLPNPNGNMELYRLTEKAFALLEQPTETSAFISYHRRESSAFALLVLARFRMLGLQPFLDMNLEPGDDWAARLEHEVKGREYLVCLIGPHTLESAYVRQEILWALEAHAQIIPIWHNGFSDAQLAAFKEQYPELGVFYDKQAIRVEQENAVAYEGGIIQLLNRFGMMP